MTSPMLESVGDPSLTPVMEPLRRTAPWVRFIAVLNFVFAGVTLLFAVGLVFVPIPGGPEGFSRFFGLVYVPMGLLYLLPAILSLRYAKGISEFIQVSSANQLAVALHAQRRVWKFWGIFLAVGLIFGLLVSGIMIVALISVGGPAGIAP